MNDLSKPRPVSFYIKYFNYDVMRDFLEKKDLKDLFEYKKSVLRTNGFTNLVDNLVDNSPKFNRNQYDEQGLEIALDVEDVYPVSLEDEKNEILLRAQNFHYLGATHKNFEYCRTRCKITDQRLRNFTLFPSENQMCVTDCMNIRTELFNKSRPGSENKEKNFVWLA
jgi:hypothetical protein